MMMINNIDYDDDESNCHYYVVDICSIYIVNSSSSIDILS